MKPATIAETALISLINVHDGARVPNVRRKNIRLVFLSPKNVVIRRSRPSMCPSGLPVHFCLNLFLGEVHQ